MKVKAVMCLDEVFQAEILDSLLTGSGTLVFYVSWIESPTPLQGGALTITCWNDV